MGCGWSLNEVASRVPVRRPPENGWELGRDPKPKERFQVRTRPLQRQTSWERQKPFGLFPISITNLNLVYSSEMNWLVGLGDLFQVIGSAEYETTMALVRVQKCTVSLLAMLFASDTCTKYVARLPIDSAKTSAHFRLPEQRITCAYLSLSISLSDMFI